MTRNLFIKVCGNNCLPNIELLLQSKINAIGFIFYSKSKRCITEQILDKVNFSNQEIKKVAVFVNENIFEVKRLVNKYNFDFVQLHGNESIGYCKKVKEFTNVIKAIDANASQLQNVINSYSNSVDILLFDNFSPSYGGTGSSFNHTILNDLQFQIPYLIAGGIDEEIILSNSSNYKNPFFLGYDINSKFEYSPGKKNVFKINTMLNKIKVYETK